MYYKYMPCYVIEIDGDTYAISVPSLGRCMNKLQTGTAEVETEK